MTQTILAQSVKIPKIYNIKEQEIKTKKICNAGRIINTYQNICIAINEDNVLVSGYKYYVWYINHNIKNIPYVKTNFSILNQSAIRKYISKRDFNTCYICGCVDHNGTLDHVYPKSKGGLTIVENLRWCCIECNQNKQSMLVSEII